MITVLYDDQIFTNQKYGGISRYFNELIQSSPEYRNSKSRTKLSLILSKNEYINKHKNCFLFKSFLLTRLINRINRIRSILMILFSKYDVFHPTYYNPYFLKYLKKPFVLTIHDMIHEKFPNLFPINDPTSINKKLLSQKASRIIAISENTKKDIITYLHIPESKIDVIYHGYTNLLSENIISLDLPEKFCLFVGTRNTYKNFKTLLIAFWKIHATYNDFKLVCVGGGDFTPEEYSLMKEYDLINNVIQINVDDQKLALIYKKAYFFVFPSIYEGFGLPILEAMGLGCPMILSDASCFKEIARESALYFDPLDPDSLLIQMIALVNSNELRENLIREMNNRIRFFSWNNTRLNHLLTYSKALNRNE
jgi:glycosyltransferase involved in cell wall biosynthesis